MQHRLLWQSACHIRFDFRELTETDGGIFEPAISTGQESDSLIKLTRHFGTVK
jgi:hypothetical protein